MIELRYKVWLAKMSNKNLQSAPKLKLLPPTTEAFVEHVYRAHLQTALWKSSMDSDPPHINPIQLGWSKDENNVMVPVPIPPDVSSAPLDVLKLIKCGCSSDNPCGTTKCSCSAAQLAWSMVCACYDNCNCKNDRTKRSMYR